MSDMIEFKTTISTKEFCRLRESVGFQKLSEEQAKTVLSNTPLLVNAVNNGRSVGYTIFSYNISCIVQAYNS